VAPAHPRAVRAYLPGQLLHRDADGDLADPRLAVGAADGDEHRAWLRARADAAGPTPRNQRGPLLAISARWARVSTFCTRVGTPCSPRSVIRGGMNVGIAGPPARWLTS